LQGKKEDGEFIGVSKIESGRIGKEDVEMNDIDRLREENKRLKRTLKERFDETFN
jgi:hypothetical protein